jgi:hypothetical protein
MSSCERPFSRIQTEGTPLFAARSVVRISKTIRRPSGAKRGSDTRTRLTRSFAVNGRVSALTDAPKHAANKTTVPSDLEPALGMIIESCGYWPLFTVADQGVAQTVL